jgi:hypothetical protein
MIAHILIGACISVVNFVIHAAITGLIVVATRRIAAATDDRHIFVRVVALLTVAGVVLMVAHGVEISIWASYYGMAGIMTAKATPFEFAFENFTALGYGDTVPAENKRLVGPITALNGLLLIGWSVAIIFEVMRMAELQIGRDKR